MAFDNRKSLFVFLLLLLLAVLAALFFWKCGKPGVSLEAPAEAMQGAVVEVAWTGPDGEGDYIIVVPRGAPDNVSGNYKYTREGRPLKVPAPIEPGPAELRYVAGEGGKVLLSRPITILPAPAGVKGPETAVAGSKILVEWTGPDNEADYVTIVSKDAPDGKSGNYKFTKQGALLEIAAPMETGEAELRYMTGQGNKVLARAPIMITAPEVSLTAPSEAVAGGKVEVSWSGPNNEGDYVTIVPKDKPDGQSGNYTYTNQGSPLVVLVPIEPGEAEFRYMSGQGNKVLARSPVVVKAAEITLTAPAQATIGGWVEAAWTGPNNEGDYLTIVAKGAPDTQFGPYLYTSQGSPLKLPTSAELAPGTYEVRYLSGQGNKVLGRADVELVK